MQYRAPAIGAFPFPFPISISIFHFPFPVSIPLPFPAFPYALKRQLESQKIQLEKTAVVKVGAYIVSIDKKTTVYKLEACEIAFFEMRALAVHSDVLPYFTDLPVSSSL